MKILSIIFSIALLFYSCTVTSPAEPPEVECIDYYGNAAWTLTDSTFTAILSTNFTGTLTGAFIDTDSGRVLVATLTGTLVPDIGDRKRLFTKTGSLVMAGIFSQANGEYTCRLWATGEGTDGLKGTTGDLDLNWPITDDTIYYVGTFCMVPNPE